MTADGLLTEVEVVQALPRSARRLVEVLGLRDTLALCLKVGGRRVRLTPGSAGRAELASLVGGEARAAQVAEALGVPRWDAPRCAALEVRLRHAAIRRDHRAGLSVDQLVDRYGNTRRAIQNLVRQGA